jgi:hypothetical protein
MRIDRFQKNDSAVGSRFLKGNNFVGIFAAPPPSFAVLIDLMKTTQKPMRARKFDRLLRWGQIGISVSHPSLMHDSTTPPCSHLRNRTIATLAACAFAAAGCLFSHPVSA